MKEIKILTNRIDINWDYNDETDTFFLSAGNPQGVTDIDIGEGLVVYYDQIGEEIIGFNLTGLRSKLLKKLSDEISSVEEDKKVVEADRKITKENEESIRYGKQAFDQGGES
jgi:hypothetical protein